MKILIVGAGAIGGYFGGRLAEKGEDVTFLVREKRKKQLEETGLVIESVHGNVLLTPKVITASEEAGPFDCVLLSTKAYHLQGAIESIGPYVGNKTVIVPMLNGILHLQTLMEEFGEDRVIGGLCFIETTLDAAGRVIQTSPTHDFVFGELSGKRTERVERIEKAFTGTKTAFRVSTNIREDMWKKYLFIAVMSGITTLMRAPIGPIREDEFGRATISRLIDELVSVMRKLDAPLPDGIEGVQLKQMDGLGYSMKASMQRDMEKSLPVEADHLHGFLLEAAHKEGIPVPVLEAVYANLKIYEGQL